MESAIAYLDQVPDWDESDEHIQLGRLELKRFTTLHGVISVLLSGDEAEVDHETVDTILLCLPSFSNPRDLLSFLIDRFDVKRLSNATNSCREQRQLKILSIIYYWLKTDAGTSDMSGSIIDTMSEFIEEVIARSTKLVSSTACKIRARIKTVRENLLNAERALELFRERTRHLLGVTSSQLLSEEAEESRNSEDSSEDAYSRGSAHSSAYLSRASRRGSESSLVNVSLGGTSDDMVRSEMLIAEFGSISPARENISNPDTRRTPPKTSLPGSRQSITPRSPVGPTVTAASYSSIVKILPYAVLAEMLTIIEYEAHLRNIRGREFISLGWTNKSSKVVHPDLGGSANLSRVLANNNLCIAWIAREIVDYARRVGPAAECIEYFVRVARECLKRNNLNSFFLIVAALGLPAVLQLKTAWTNVSQSKQDLFKSFLQICSCDDDYSHYRTYLASLNDQPVIPCIQILVRDVTSIESSGPWIVGGRIDIQKAKTMYAIISSSIHCQKVGVAHPAYDVEISNVSYGHEEISMPLTGRDRLSERGLALQSYLMSWSQLSSSEVWHLVGVSSFIHECVALRQSLFFPVRVSAQPALAVDPVGEYVRGQHSSTRSSAPEDRVAHSSPGIFKRLIKSVKSMSFSATENNIFHLVADNSQLLMLQTVINSTCIDLNLLSEDSRLADDAESRRLIGKLTKAGLF